MRWIWVGALSLILGGCYLGPPEEYSHGELGASEFSYDCVGPSDPRCDDSFDFGQGTACTVFCDSLPPPENHRIPGPIAVGASFDLYTGTSAGDYEQPFPASDEMVRYSLIFTALAPGWVAMIAGPNSNITDFVHIHLMEATRIRIDRVFPDAASVEDATGLSLVPGERAWIRALPFSGSTPLYGALPCEWTLDGTPISVLSDPSDNLITVRGDATGLARLTVDLGELTQSFSVSVGEASALEEVDR